MKRVILISLALFSLFSCEESKNTKKNRIAKGDRVYGGALKLSELDPYQTLFPISITDVISTHVSTQIYEGLVKFNPQTLAVIPCIAEGWDIDTSSTVYTFRIKKGIRFHDDPCFPDGKGREVEAEDIKYSFRLLCTQSPDNLNFQALFKGKIKGADKYFDASASGKPSFDIDGIQAVDKYTVKIVLERPNSSFLYILTHPGAFVVAKESVEKYGNKSNVGTGAFEYASEEQNPGRLILTRNENYHAFDEFGNQLPYLDSIIFSFMSSQHQELDEFKKGNLDMIYRLPAESIKEMVEENIAAFQQKPPKYILERGPELTTQYYELNTQSGIFSNKKVRQALSYAIDRKKIIEDVLKGEAWGPGIYGMSPPSFKGYDVSKIKGYDLDIAKAKKLLAEAGYPDGKGFPKVTAQLNSGGKRHTNVIMEIIKQLKENLNIDLDFSVISLSQKLEDSRNGKMDLSRAGWTADYPSPENFLMLFYGRDVPDSAGKPSYPNTTRYKNPEYDKLYEAGMAAIDKEVGYKYFLEAEQLMVNDVPALVLWYEEAYRLLQYKVRNFHNNPMQFRDCSIVYFAVPETGSKPK